MWNIQKIDEFLNSLPPNAPQIICLTERHLRAEEIRNILSGCPSRCAGLL